jgi:hypothetical protein
MKKFVEKKIVKIFNKITMILGISMLISLALSVLFMIIGTLFPSSKPIVDPLFVKFLSLILILPTSALPFIIATHFLSKKSKYTKEFIEYIDNKISTATTLEELIEINTEFNELLLTNGKLNLSPSQELIDIKKEILNKIEILQLIESKYEYRRIVK